jgi:hypothetical protein
MPITAQEVPTRTHTSKYEFNDNDVAAAVKMLKAGEHPGERGFEKEGQARSAASHLIEQCSAVSGAPEQIGSRAWKADDGKWAFGLKIGKRTPNGKDS